ncbi:MAG: LON peptidase substrate-binding domain-containing protein [Bdellovibrionales bacterium]|nr:LON peptidase substrate-binding domain-containing protein [Bdellovibrionales bacterium]NQZ20193.1 LON peptidase substrate-binding domain-containing protein [Bdellovibrionales bacterium]
MAETDQQSIALFPIPGMVCFPYSLVPLHVFEPRYRKMINDCIENQMWLGVCHIESVLHESQPKEDLREALKSNQSTYKPQAVFSAGPCKLVETSQDGRLFIEVKMEKRFMLKDRVQEVPYQIYDCEPLPEVCDDETVFKSLRDKLDNFLLKYAEREENKELKTLIDSPEWKEISSVEYSYSVAPMIQSDPDYMQVLLESPSAEERLSLIHRVLGL